MADTSEINESPEKQVTKSPEKKIDTFDDLRSSDKSGRIETFDDIRKQDTDKSINTFDDLRGEKETDIQTVRLNKDNIENERISSSSSKISFSEGRHRGYVAAKEGYDNVPVKLNDVYTQKDGKTMIDKRDITHVNFDKDVLNSEDMQNMMKEHDFKQWEQGIGEHKGFTYNDHVKEFDRLKECQEAIKNGHSPNEIESMLGKEHAETYKRFYETRPIKIDRVIEME
jgi:hypothetical protein